MFTAVVACKPAALSRWATSAVVVVLPLVPVIAGNIGRPVTDLAMSNERYQWLSLEVSSFQLHDSPNFAPEIGVLTNLAPDHLDRYPSVEAYYADKRLLFRNASSAQVWVLNGDEPAVLELAAGVPGR